MDFYEVIEKRKSIKSFTNNEIDKEKLSRILKAAMMAPSWKNHTSYRIIIVSDEGEKSKIADTIMNDSDFAANSIKQAPMVVVVAADPDESGEVAEKDYYLVDSAIALEHLVLAAAAEGYGTCWIAAFNECKIKDILSVPDKLRIVALTPLGEVKEDKDHFPPKDMSKYVFVNKWDNPYENKIKM